MPHIVRATPFALMDETTQRAFEDALPGSGSRRSTTLIDLRRPEREPGLPG